jgi:hypothetical protein
VQQGLRISKQGAGAENWFSQIITHTDAQFVKLKKITHTHTHTHNNNNKNNNNNNKINSNKTTTVQ